MQLGYSFCPNDTFIFYALSHGKIATPAPVTEVLEDVETLNVWAMEGRLPLTKISYAAYGRLREHYVALRSGGALGRGVGPLLVARNPLDNLRGKRIAIPGRHTTAFLLLSLRDEGFIPLEMRYDRIMPAVQAGEVDAGLIIHESRFTYPRYGLVKVFDLGEWWEGETGLPLPLGAILARRDLGEPTIRALDRAVRESLEYAHAHPEETVAYIKQHALEMEDEVIWAHIRTYVNEFSLDVGEEGERAVNELFKRAEERGLLPRQPQPAFLI
ncbi:menaquinone biosynthesis family protein [Calidithermus roseus]|uniref:1,4-dihydroxy-6-naphtoate synthase n=1 Tax=Calidithermus roseus TaxID=1644118 RepID=A0A399EMW6_9DEIN|nr:1,4-dihydroxy-6-naphthoate synthase [Calidithermus roseus]RIH85318.1 1,4-dihydroxy-6-naphtoate synthase [Calidithermus roseus]